MNVRLLLSALLLSLLLASTAVAQGAPRHPFPADYTPHPCAAVGACARNFTHVEMARLGDRMFGLAIDLDWVKAHEKELNEQVFRPMCLRVSTCFAMPGNSAAFCNDSVVGEMRSACDRYTDAKEREKCREYVEMYMLGIDNNSIEPWKEAQSCMNSRFPAWKSEDPPVVWMEPARLPSGFNQRMKIFAQDAHTKVPVQARITIGDQVLFSKTNPNGRVDTYYPFIWPIRLVRTLRADGHHDLVPPMVTVQGERYPAVTFRMPYDVPVLKTAITPSSKLRRGKNRITVTSVDSVTGKPIEMRVMAGTRTIGDTNKPIDADLGSAKIPEIWITSLFDRYSDVVIVPAPKK